MAQLTIRLLDGADRGRIYEELETPITIGREEGNSIQLNDERVSRFHLKIQEDHDKLVLTDLASTNGTRVNGEDIQLRIVRYGDIVAVGRSILLMGSRENIAARLAELRKNGVQPKSDEKDEKQILSDEAEIDPLDFELNWQESQNLQATLFSLQPPEIPEGLSPGQAAQLSELLEYMHIRMRHLLLSVEAEDQPSGRVQLDLRRWQEAVDLQANLALYLRTIGDPNTY